MARASILEQAAQGEWTVRRHSLEVGRCGETGSVVACRVLCPPCMYVRIHCHSARTTRATAVHFIEKPRFDQYPPLIERHINNNVCEEYRRANISRSRGGSLRRQREKRRIATPGFTLNNGTWKNE